MKSQICGPLTIPIADVLGNTGVTSDLHIYIFRGNNFDSKTCQIN